MAAAEDRRKSISDGLALYTVYYSWIDVLGNGITASSLCSVTPATPPQQPILF